MPTSALFATHGHKVVGVDISKERVDCINLGKVPFDEPGLSELLNKAVSSGNLTASIKLIESDVFLIAVPTPLNKEMKMAELQSVKQAAEMISLNLKRGNLVILESTVPPGTTERLLIPILERSGLKARKDFFLAHCPERAIPGNTIREMIHNDRIIGGIDNKSSELAKSLYSCFVKGSLYLTDARTAEFVKLMENTYRDINIALANEFAQIAEESQVNVWDAIELANKHPRVEILKPGPGVGGHCLAVDPWFLVSNPVKSHVITIARQINDSMPNHIMTLVKNLIDGINSPIITVLGVAYKGDVDDTRETPALKFIKLVENEGITIKVHDPLVKQFEYKIYSLDEAARDSDCLVLLTDHSMFNKINPSDLSKVVRTKNFIDCRNFVNHEKWKDAGFKVRKLGDGTS